MTKMTLEYNLADPEDRADADRAILTERLCYALSDFENALRNMSKHECGPIKTAFDKEKKQWPSESDGANMLDAVSEVYYELIAPFKEFIE